MAGISSTETSSHASRLRRLRQGIAVAKPAVTGRLVRSTNQFLTAQGCIARRGEICKVFTSNDDSVEALAVSFDGDVTQLFTFDEKTSLRPGDRVVPQGHGQLGFVGYGLLGRVVDSKGQPVDEKGSLTDAHTVELDAPTINPMVRTACTQPLDVGVRAINTLLTLGRGQRIGLFAASGLGKSVLLGMITRHTVAEIAVVCLIGERGREVKEFVVNSLGESGLHRTVVVAIPADHSALRKVSGAAYATRIAEYFRDLGHHVLLIMDSLTRFAQAGRELGLASGELPVAGGYTTSVLSDLPKLLERAGTAANGSITAIYTVLVESGEKIDPLAELAKSYLDGHIVLSRELAEAGHFPAIDVLESTSRLFSAVTDEGHQQLAGELLQLLSHYKENADLISLGMYQHGTDILLDTAIARMPAINGFLRQPINDKCSINDSQLLLRSLLSTEAMFPVNGLPAEFG